MFSDYIYFFFHWLTSDYKMSLSYFLWNNFQLDPDFYECTENVTITVIGAKQVVWGIYFLVSGLFILVSVLNEA